MPAAGAHGSTGAAWSTGAVWFGGLVPGSCGELGAAPGAPGGPGPPPPGVDDGAGEDVLTGPSGVTTTVFPSSGVKRDASNAAVETAAIPATSMSSTRTTRGVRIDSTFSAHRENVVRDS